MQKKIDGDVWRVVVLPTAWVKKEILTFLGNCSIHLPQPLATLAGGAVAGHVTREMRTAAIEVESRYNKCQTQEDHIGRNTYRRRYYTNGKMKGITTKHDQCERRHANHLTTPPGPPHYVSEARSEGQTQTVWNGLLCIVQ